MQRDLSFPILWEICGTYPKQDIDTDAAHLNTDSRILQVALHRHTCFLPAPPSHQPLATTMLYSTCVNCHLKNIM